MFASFIATLAILASAGPSSQPAGDTEFDFSALAHAYFTSHEIDPEGLTFPELIDGSDFLRFTIGAFDVRYPVSDLGKKSNCDELKEFALTLLDLQEHWHAWRNPDTGNSVESADLAKDWKVLRKWVDKWSSKKLAKCHGGAEALLDQLKAKDAVKSAQARLAHTTRPNPKMAEWVGENNVLVISSTRKSFLELLAVGGELDPTKREALWSQKNLGRTAAWFNWTEILCTVQADYPIDLASPYEPHSMDTEDETGTMQFLADRSALLLLRKEFFPNGTHFFEVTLGTNLVIETVGENNQHKGDWNLEYKTSGSSTRPFSRFVPGGNPSGGSLPARRAGVGAITGSAVEISSYRTDGGAQYFFEALQEGQKEGFAIAEKDKSNSLRKSKVAHFKLYSFETHKSTSVTAPFLGDGGKDKVLPSNEFLDDYEDFFRAYRAGFVHWLQIHGAGSRAAAPELFSRLLTKQSERAVDVVFHDVVEAVYGLPLSSPDPETDSLEWRYLAWIKKGK